MVSGRRGTCVSSVLAGLTLALISGCQDLPDREPARTYTELIQSYHALADALATVRDRGSAEAATSEVDIRFTQAIKLLESLPALLSSCGGDALPASIQEGFQRDRKEAEGRLNSELERVRALRGLPTRFWGVIRLRGLAMNLAAARMLPETSDARAVQFMSDVRAMLEQHGQEQVVGIRMTNLPSDFHQGVVRRITAAAPGAKIVDRGAGGNVLMYVAPVQDYWALLACLTFGRVTARDDGQRELEFDVDRYSLGVSFAANDEPPQVVSNDRQPKEEPARAGGEVENAERPRQVTAETAERLGAQNGAESGDSAYFEDMARRMLSDRSDQCEKAIDAMLDASPQDAPPPARKAVADAFRTLATGSKFTTRQVKGMRGLALWTGPESVSVLTGLLDDKKAPPKAVYEVLAELKDAHAAAAVAAKLKDSSDRAYARTCLKTMGSVAEPAVLGLVGNDDPNICLAAIDVLSEIGTPQSLPALRRLTTHSRTPTPTRTAAMQATKRIREREGNGGSKK
jgi:hypothetical protein